MPINNRRDFVGYEDAVFIFKGTRHSFASVVYTAPVIPVPPLLNQHLQRKINYEK